MIFEFLRGNNLNVYNCLGFLKSVNMYIHNILIKKRIKSFLLPFLTLYLVTLILPSPTLNYLPFSSSSFSSSFLSTLSIHPVHKFTMKES